MISTDTPTWIEITHVLETTKIVTAIPDTQEHTVNNVSLHLP